MSRLTLTLCGVAVLCSSLNSIAVADDWRQFRGTLTDAVSRTATPPASIDQETVAWKADLPGRGTSCPIVVGDRVYLTCSSGPQQAQLQVLCFTKDSGKELWRRTFKATGRTMAHKKMAVATPTPCSDGKRIFATFSSNDVVCLDLEGNFVWARGLTFDYPNASNSLGMSSSPVVAGNVLVVQVEADAEALAVGLDVTNGTQLWKVDRPRKANWTSPSVLQTDDGLKVVLQSSQGVAVIEPATGAVIASYDNGAATIPSSTVSGGLIFTPNDGITALKVTTGDELERLWSSSKLQPSTASPVAFGGVLYTVNRSGALTAGSLEDGERQYQVRAKGPFSATPVIADGRIYLVNEAGLLQVAQLKAGEKAELTSSFDLGETILATPALSEGAVYIRSDKTLWKIGK